MNKPTLIIGASTNPERYSYIALHELRSNNIPVYAIGLRPAKLLDVEIQKGQPELKDVDTITLYLNPQRQQEYYNYILSLKPRRIIFNPGTENRELEKLASDNGIETIRACTLVMLSIGDY